MENSIENNLNKFFDQITENVKKERKARNISQFNIRYPDVITENLL